MRSIQVTAACVLVSALAACSTSSSRDTGATSPTSQPARSTATPAAGASTARPATSRPTPVGTGCDTGAITPLCDTIRFTGAIPVSGRVEQSAQGADGLAKSCADVAGGRSNGPGNRTFPVPHGPFGKVDGHRVTIDATVKYGHYRGPGSYGPIDLDTSGGVFVDDTRFDVGPATTASIVVRADGSGALVFVSLVNASGRTESGTFSWTCSFA